MGRWWKRVKTWCKVRELPRDGEWVSCPVCWDSCRAKTEKRLWLNMQRIGLDSFDAVSFTLGEEDGGHDKKGACASFTIDAVGKSSKLSRLGGFLLKLRGVCNDAPMRVFARWHMRFLQTLGIGKLKASDQSYFVCMA